MLKKINPSAIYIFVIMSCVITIFFYPTAVIGASRSGLLLWFNTVLPSLFPFIVFSNLLIGLGGTRVIGFILEPVMRPVFNVSGAGAIAYVMGLFSGYPVGAKITADLLQANRVTRTEAQRLLSFCNNSGPLFMLGAVGVGMFGNANVGFFIMLVHYLSSLATGILFRFYGVGRDGLIPPRNIGNKKSAQPNTTIGFGALLSESVQSATDLSVQVGGFIMLFSVIMELMSSSGALSVVTMSLYGLLRAVDPALHNGVVAGIIEITNGIKAISDTAPVNALLTPELFFKQKMIFTCALVSWGGISIFAQTVSIIVKTGLSAKTYLLSKLIQAFFAAMLCSLLYPIFAARFF